MPLDKQVVGVNFTKGLETHTDKRITIPGTMIALQNVTLSENETFVRRNGTGAVASGTAISGLAVHDHQLLAIDSATLKSYSPAANAVNSFGTISTVTLTEDELVHTTGTQDLYDVATLDGFTCYVWRDYLADGTLNGVKYQILDETSGDVVVAPTLLSAVGYSPRVVAFSNAFVLLYGGAATTINFRVVPTSSISTLGAETALITDFSPATPVMDACADSAKGYVYYVCSVASVNSTKAASFTFTGTTPALSAGPTVVSAEATFTRANTIGMAIVVSGSVVFVAALVNAAAAAGMPGMWSAVLTTGMVVSFAVTRQDATAAPSGNYGAITAIVNGSTFWVYSDDAGAVGGAAATTPIRRTGINTSNAATSAAATWALSAIRANGTNGPYIASKAFVANSANYIPMFIVEAGTGSLQNSWFLFDASAVPVARALYGTFGDPATGTTNWMQASAPTLTSGEVVAMIREVTLLSFSSGKNVSTTGLNRLRVKVNSTTPLIEDQIGPCSYFANGILSCFDNIATTEAAFNLFPEVVSAAQGAAGNVPDGAHGIVALYEWFDATGQRHQSAPSVAITLTVAAGPATCTITVPSLFLSQKSLITVAAYATTAGGTIYYRVTPLNVPVANSTTAATVTVTYNLTDANLATGEVLYTTGGALPNNGPPPCSVLAVHQNRVFINVSDDPYAFQYSQPWVSGFGVQWNETLRGRVESTGGVITGFASIDDKLIIFRPRKFGVLFGQGPTTSGAQNGYQVIDQPTDVGCTEPRSILVTPQGVMFKSTSKGWYILGRDLQLNWIGGGVEDWDSQGVTSAVLLDTIHECRFTTNDASGLTLVYDYTSGQWGTSSNYTGVDAVWWPGGNAYVRATATSIIKELPATAAGYAYGDGATSTAGTTPTNAPTPFTGSTIPMVFQTGWLKPGEALQAFQRIWRVLLTGAAAGYVAPSTTISSNILAGVTTIPVVSTAAFANDDLSSLTLGLGTARYETTSDGASIASATSFELVTATTQDHNIGDTFRGLPVLGAAGTLEVSFYFDGNDNTAYQTITISDVADLVNGNAWNVRLQPNLQKCSSIMMKVTSTPASNDPGASLNFSGMTLELGVKKGAKKFNAAQTK